MHLLTFVLPCRRATTECFAIPVIDWNQSKLHFVTTGILAALAVAYSLQTLAGLWKFRCCMKRGHRPKTAKSSLSTFNHALPDVRSEIHSACFAAVHSPNCQSSQSGTAHLCPDAAVP